MKLDRFLAELFSKRTLVLLLVIVIALSCLTACQLTCEDILCLAMCGCLSLDTCHDMMMKCDCSCDGTMTDFEGERVDCNRSNCIGESYNGCFNCIWEGGLKDCRPSKVCDSCSGDNEE